MGLAHDEMMKQIWTTKEGVICPCCEKATKVTRQPISSAQVRALAWVYRKTRRGQYIHFNENAPRVFVKSASIGKLKHWGLIDQMPNFTDPSKNKSGYVMITDLGTRWLSNQAAIVKYRYIYNDKCLGEDGPMVSITRYHSKEFHYERDVTQAARPA